MMLEFGDRVMPLLPRGEKDGMRGFEVVDDSQRWSPLTLPSPRRGEGR